MSTRKQMLNRGMVRALMLSLFMVCNAMQLLPLLRVLAQTSVENDFVAMLNAERAMLGKNPLSTNFQLSAAACLHSQDMAEQDYFSHTSLDGRTFDQRIIAAGYTDYVSLAENIAYAYGAPDAARVYGMWKNSTGHYANMMGDFDEAGLGICSKNGYTYYTLDLGKSRATPIPELHFVTMLFAFFPLAFAFTLIARSRRALARTTLRHDWRALDWYSDWNRKLTIY